MALKSKRPTAAGASRGGLKFTHSHAGKVLNQGHYLMKTPGRGRRTAPAETIEARLERKAAVADTKAFATKSLGQMTREQRHKLLYGD
jgi:hypothetical protein